MEHLRILFLAACPADQDRLKVEDEYKAIEGELDRSLDRKRFDCRYVPAVGRVDLVRQLLRIRPHVLHFSGHGSDTDELVLENADGTSEPLTADELEQLFSAVPPTDRPRVAVFNACYSEGQASAVARVIDCSIGMSSQIRDSAAFDFARGFYLALGQGLSVDAAVAMGRRTMPTGFGDLPALHVRDSVTLAELQLMRSGPVSRFPTDFHIDRNEQMDCFRSMLETGEPRVLVLTADGNMGKTCLVQAMARVAAEHHHAISDLSRGAKSPEDVITALAIGVGTDVAVAQSASFGSQRLLEGTAVAGPTVAAERHRSLIAATDELFTAAESVAVERGRRPAFLVDGLNDPSGDVAAWVEGIFLPRALRSERVVCVIAGREKPGLVAGHHLMREFALSNFELDDVREAMALLRLDTSESVVRTFWVTATDRGQPSVTLQRLEVLWRDTIESMSTI